AISVINRVGAEMAEEPYWSSFITSPPQALRVDELGDSGIEIKILGSTKPIRQWEVTGELRKRLKKVFDEEGIEIPWPHTKVFFGTPPPPRVATEAPAEVMPRDDAPTPEEEGE
ncbi:MAG: mechanosensitive ion channel family protein, partial [Dehalococcoidia bacterium]